MSRTLANLIIQIVAGLIGANIAAVAAHEHRFGFWGHSLVGLIGGGLSGLSPNLFSRRSYRQWEFEHTCKCTSVRYRIVDRGSRGRHRDARRWIHY